MCNRFTTRRRNSTTYTCECCGKRTRETGNEESTRDLCLACDLAGEIENMMSDYRSNFTQEQIDGVDVALKAANADTATADTAKIVSIHSQVANIAYA
jgi:hypothetical protein